MKFVFLALMSLVFISCASHEKREPSSLSDEVSRGENADRHYRDAFY